jgi:electron transfer flavoprotein alpha subunit
VPVNRGNTILVYCEVKNEKTLTTLSRELLSCARLLGDKLGQTVTAVVLGHRVRKGAGEAIAFGADTLILADHDLLASWQPDLQVKLLEEICGREAPGILLFGHTDRGRDLAPRLAFRRRTFAYMDCVSVLACDEAGSVEYTRPVYGGSIYAVYNSSVFPQIATLRKGAAAARAAEPGREGRVEEITPVPASGAPRTRTVRRERTEESGVRLEDAAAVVCGGRGIGSAEDFQQLREVAGLLKGALGATRPPCDEGWVPDLLQIGLTGKIVSPDLYIAVALSGASQHITGCSKARTIVAINKDPDAYIFKVAHYGIVGDWRKIVPSFRRRVGELVGE